ncbi:hypothetical protein ACFPIK_08890 [Algoriphagus aquatilis]|uniref:Uncharacterized protein n=1 Tax=Algoriphagus aquatilis TaxID=490186 RepID=A0ABW0BVF9_9BACT
MINVEIVKDERLRILHSALVIRVGAIYPKTEQTIFEFSTKYNLPGVTNGRVWVMAEMEFPWDYLQHVAVDILQKNGLVEKWDYVLTYERNCYSNPFESGYLYRDIPELEGLDWIESIILETGNWAWSRY